MSRQKRSEAQQDRLAHIIEILGFVPSVVGEDEKQKSD